MPDSIREKLISELAGEDLRLFNLWKGQSPQGLAMMICNDFKEKHPKWSEHYKWCGKGVFEPGLPLDEVVFPKGNTWAELEANLKQAARRFVFDSDCLQYWDNMRTFWKLFPGDPRQRGRRRVYRREMKGLGWEEARPVTGMGVCDFCWRSVPVKDGSYSKLLCHVHDLPSSDPVYRRRHRMRYGKNSQGESKNFDLIHKRIELVRPLATNQYVTYCSDNLRMEAKVYSIDDAWIVAPFLVVELLPHVHGFLMRNDVDITSNKNIIRSLESPIPIGESNEEVENRSLFYRECTNHFRLYVDHLIWAEIWLQLEACSSWGGKRKGAGRKAKK